MADSRRVIHRIPFAWWVQEIVQKQCSDLYFKATAILTLQEVTDAYAVKLFEDANLSTIHAKQVTVGCQRTFNWPVGSGGYGKISSNLIRDYIFKQTF